MNVSIKNVYTGRNVYLDAKALLLEIDVDGFSSFPEKSLCSEAYGRLSAMLPLIELDFTDLENMFAECSAAVICGLQELVNHRSFASKVLDSKQAGFRQIVCEYRDLEQGRSAVIFGGKIFSAIMETPEMASDKWLRHEVDGFIQRAGNVLDQTTSALLAEAEKRGIPWYRISDALRVIQIGQGHKSKRIVETNTSNTGLISQLISRSKLATVDVLRPVGVPVPRQRVLLNAEQLAKASKQVEFPLVVKPRFGSKGRGVTAGINSYQELTQAYQIARAVDRLVVLESFIPGDDHRALVVDGKLVAVAKRLPACVVGDGKHSIEQLVEVVNRDPRRGFVFEKLLVKIKLDARSESILQKCGLNKNSVPAIGETIRLHGTANISTGGTAVDVTDQVHPDNIRILERAARAVGLDIAGVDYITPDISRSFREVGGAVCEVNSSPGLRPHWVADSARDVVTPVYKSLFPESTAGTIPCAAITGSSGKTTTCRMLGEILKSAGHTVGMTSTDGAYVDGQLTLEGDVAGSRAASAIFRDPDITSAVLESSRGGLIKSGLGCDAPDVGVVLNVREDHLGNDGIATLEEMAAVKALVAKSATDWVVLNAEDALCVAMAEGLKAKVCYVSYKRNNPVVLSHLAAGGVVVLLDSEGKDQKISLKTSENALLVNAADIPATFNGTALHNSINAAFAAATAWCMGCSAGQIENGLKKFSCDYENARGRMNICDKHPFTVVMDFAHNPDKLAALVAWVNIIKAGRRCIGVITSPGNRLADHFDKLAAQAADCFDLFICSPWGEDYRGRGPLEVQHLIRDGLIKSGVAEDRIIIGETEPQAVQKALELAEREDLVVICSKSHERTWGQIVNFS